jgi:catechol 2,3-dioxygenase-like lactoylglutathione lyase family enzyme
VLNQVNVIARDWDASLDFYRALGLELDAGHVWPPGTSGRHASVEMPNDVQLEFDNEPMLSLYAGEPAASFPGTVIGFVFASATDVDTTVERLLAAGHRVRRSPYDAFWGARYAIVEDPSGNAVGLMGPRDRSRGYVPVAASS